MAISGLGGNYADSSLTESTTRNMQAPASSTLTMDNFMLLLATELQNQDMNSPMSNSEMMQQLTSMATVQSMNTFSELSSTQYALNLMGKEVKVMSTNDVTGKMEMKTGEIVGINLSSMKVYIKGDDAPYGLGNVMEIGDVPKPKDDKNDTTKPGDKDPGKEDPENPGSPGDDGDNTGKDNSKTSKAMAYNTDPRTVDDGKSGRIASNTGDENSRTDPVTGRTATRVSRDNQGESKAASASAYGSGSGGKTYTDSRALRMEYLASDKREALEHQYEIPEDKRAILASRSLMGNARGPAAEFSNGNPANVSANASSKSSFNNITLDPRQI